MGHSVNLSVYSKCVVRLPVLSLFFLMVGVRKRQWDAVKRTAMRYGRPLVQYGAKAAGRWIADQMVKPRPKKRQMVAATRRSRVRRTFTTGGYKGRFRGRKRRARASRAQRSGAVFKTEFGGSIVDSDCVYVGHVSCPIDTMQRALFMALTRKVFEKAGYQVTDWTQLVGFTGELHLSWYYQIQAVSPNVTTFPFTGGVTSYSTIADGILSLLNVQVPSDKVPILHEVALWHGTTLKIGHINLNSASASFNCYSELSIQNRTTADSGAGTNTESALNITNNPLHGLSYFGYGTSFYPLNLDSTLVAYVPFVADENYGHFAVKSANSLPVVGRKPPQANFFSGSVKTSACSIVPGGIKKNVLFTKVSMKIPDFYVKFRTGLDNAVSTPIKVGKIQMFALEKMMNTREADEPNVNVGYEVNTTVSCTLSFKNAAPTARLLISS